MQSNTSLKLQKLKTDLSQNFVFSSFLKLIMFNPQVYLVTL